MSRRRINKAVNRLESGSQLQRGAATAGKAAQVIGKITLNLPNCNQLELIAAGEVPVHFSCGGVPGAAGARHLLHNPNAKHI